MALQAAADVTTARSACRCARTRSAGKPRNAIAYVTGEQAVNRCQGLSFRRRSRFLLLRGGTGQPRPRNEPHSRRWGDVFVLSRASHVPRPRACVNQVAFVLSCSYRL